MKKLKRPRFIQKLYANLFGYYWMPCPICGRYYGGHESDGEFLMDSWSGGTSVCSECNEEAEKRNEQWMADNPHPGVEVVF